MTMSPELHRSPPYSLGAGGGEVQTSVMNRGEMPPSRTTSELPLFTFVRVKLCHILSARNRCNHN